MTALLGDPESYELRGDIQFALQLGKIDNFTDHSNTFLPNIGILDNDDSLNGYTHNASEAFNAAIAAAVDDLTSPAPLAYPPFDNTALPNACAYPVILSNEAQSRSTNSDHALPHTPVQSEQDIRELSSMQCEMDARGILPCGLGYGQDQAMLEIGTSFAKNSSDHLDGSTTTLTPGSYPETIDESDGSENKGAL